MLRLFLMVVVYCVTCSSAGYNSNIRDYLKPNFVFNQECGLNEVPKGCIQPCPPEKTCQDREERICLGVYHPCQYQCHCKEGYIRNTFGGECIPIEACGIYCGRNSEYTDCKPSCQKELCFATNNPSNSSCVNEEPCKPGCVCKKGYVEFGKESMCLPRCLCPEYHYTEECSAWKKEHNFE